MLRLGRDSGHDLGHAERAADRTAKEESPGRMLAIVFDRSQQSSLKLESVRDVTDVLLDLRPLGPRPGLFLR